MGRLGPEQLENAKSPRVGAALRQPQTLDLADLCLIRMSEIDPRHSVITADEGYFGAYRRNNRETIP